MARASKKKAGPLPENERFILLVLGWAFLISATVLPGILLAKAVRGYLRTNSRVSVEAKILALDQVGTRRHRSTRVEYSYRYLGKDYVGDGVSLFGESGSLYWRLSEARNGGEPIRVWIDPDVPSFTVIDRDWHWSTMLPAAVACGGFSALGFYVIRCVKRGVVPNLNR